MPSLMIGLREKLVCRRAAQFSADEAVLGAGATTAVLWRVARPHRRLRRALDLGGGAATLDLLLAAHADRVIAVEVTRAGVEWAVRPHFGLTRLTGGSTSQRRQGESGPARADPE